MPKRRTEPTASSLLGSWTDADTAMQIVGTSLGIFEALDPDRVLAEETPLRRALFDVLLSLVEGGAVEMRTADGGRFAFRWRTDYAEAGLDPEGHDAVDVEPPPPHLEELVRLRRERDEALGRADFAEALAEERERLLRLANVPVPATRMAPADPAGVAPHLDPEGQSVLDVLYASRRTGANAAEPVPDPDPAIAEPESATTDLEAISAAEAAAPEPKPKTQQKAQPKPRSKTQQKAQPKPKAKAKAAPKPKATPARTEPATADSHDASFPTASWPGEVVYLPAATPADEDDENGPRWTGYALERPRPHLSTVEPIADEA
jgi:hypothetical protein